MTVRLEALAATACLLALLAVLAIGAMFELAAEEERTVALGGRPLALSVLVVSTGLRP
jgi:hypothetical protein